MAEKKSNKMSTKKPDVKSKDYMNGYKAGMSEGRRVANAKLAPGQTRNQDGVQIQGGTSKGSRQYKDAYALGVRTGFAAQRARRANRKQGD